MNTKESSYSLQPSNAYLYSFLVIVLIINLGIIAIAYFLITPVIENSSNPTLFSQIFWASMVVLNFILFAITYISINAFRYWVDIKHVEIINTYRPKKRKSINFKDIDYLKIRKMPLLSDAFNYGTILFLKENEKGKEKIVARFLGIKHAKDIILELMQKLPENEKGKKKIVDDLLS